MQGKDLTAGACALIESERHRMVIWGERGIHVFQGHRHAIHAVVGYCREGLHDGRDQLDLGAPAPAAHSAVVDLGDTRVRLPLHAKQRVIGEDRSIAGQQGAASVAVLGSLHDPARCIVAGDDAIDGTLAQSQADNVQVNPTAEAVAYANRFRDVHMRSGGPCPFVDAHGDRIVAGRHRGATIRHVKRNGREPVVRDGQKRLAHAAGADLHPAVAGLVVGERGNGAQQPPRLQRLSHGTRVPRHSPTTNQAIGHHKRFA